MEKIDNLPCPEDVDKNTSPVWDAVMVALQQAEEMGGVRDLDDYLILMEHIKDEVEQRIWTAKEFIGE